MSKFNEEMFEKCGWCNGGGTERAHPFDTGYPCSDCEGTGMKGGQYAESKFDEYVEEQHKKALAKELLEKHDDALRILNEYDDSEKSAQDARALIKQMFNLFKGVV